MRDPSINDAGSFASTDADGAFVIRGSYLGERRRFKETFSRDGLTMTFRGWCYPLEAYANPLERAGMLIERLREPSATEASLERFGPTDERWRRVPVFLMFRAAKARQI